MVEDLDVLKMKNKGLRDEIEERYSEFIGLMEEFKQRTVSLIGVDIESGALADIKNSREVDKMVDSANVESSKKIQRSDSLDLTYVIMDPAKPEGALTIVLGKRSSLGTYDVVKQKSFFGEGVGKEYQSLIDANSLKMKILDVLFDLFSNTAALADHLDLVRKMVELIPFVVWHNGVGDMMVRRFLGVKMKESIVIKNGNPFEQTLSMSDQGELVYNPVFLAAYLFMESILRYKLTDLSDILSMLKNNQEVVLSLESVSTEFLESLLLFPFFHELNHREEDDFGNMEDVLEELGWKKLYRSSQKFASGVHHMMNHVFDIFDNEANAIAFKDVGIPNLFLSSISYIPFTFTDDMSTMYDHQGFIVGTLGLSEDDMEKMIKEFGGKVVGLYVCPKRDYDFLADVKRGKYMAFVMKLMQAFSKDVLDTFDEDNLDREVDNEKLPTVHKKAKVAERGDGGGGDDPGEPEEDSHEVLHYGDQEEIEKEEESRPPDAEDEADESRYDDKKNETGGEQSRKARGSIVSVFDPGTVVDHKGRRYIVVSHDEKTGEHVLRPLSSFSDEVAREVDEVLNGSPTKGKKRGGVAYDM